MKKDRNCGMGMPYPNYMPNMLPGIPPMNMYDPNMSGMNYYNYNNSSSYQNQSNSFDQQFSSLNTKINSLERRISNLENLVGNNNTTYNNTNYQML